MTGELVVVDNLQDMMNAVTLMGQNAFEYAKPLAIGAGTLLLGGAGVMAKRHMASTAHESSSQNARVKRVPQGFLGLRERNNHFYNSMPITDAEGNPVLDDDGKQTFDKEFYGLMTPGLRVAPHPLRKYELINTLLTSRGAQQTTIMSAEDRQYHIDASFSWGHIKGFDDHEQRIEYRRKDGTEVSVEQLVLNGILAARNEIEVSQHVGNMVGSYMRKYFDGVKDPRNTDDTKVLDFIRDEGHDKWLDIGAEVRSFEILKVAPTDVDHFMNDLDEEKVAKVVTTVMSGLSGMTNPTSS